METLNVKRALSWLAGIAIFVYVGASGYMYAAQESLIFKPESEVNPRESVFPGSNENWVATPDGEKLQLWHRPAQEGQPTFIYLHGNAGNLGTRKRLITDLGNDGRGLVIFSWRGYGQSSGTPSEAGMYTDARAVFDWLSEQGLPADKLFVYAESLGTGVAAQLGTEREFAGIIFAAPYTSIAAMAKADYPWLPVDSLLNHRFDSIDKIKAITEPMVVMHSEDDAVIPYRFGVELFEAATEPKRMQAYTDRKHTHFTEEDIEEALTWLMQPK
jgi:fermentation-respiration switch protein FrsA (DUF1100 family)